MKKGDRVKIDHKGVYPEWTGEIKRVNEDGTVTLLVCGIHRVTINKEKVSNL